MRSDLLSLKKCFMIGKCHRTCFQCLIESSAFKTMIDVIIMSQRLLQVLFSDGENWYQLCFPKAWSGISFEPQEINRWSLMNCEPWKTNKPFYKKWQQKHLLCIIFLSVESLDCIIIFMKFWTCTCFRSLTYKIIIMGSNFNSRHSFKSGITV